MKNKKSESKSKKSKVRKSIGDVFKVAISSKVTSKPSISSSRSTNSLLATTRYSSTTINKAEKQK